MIWYKIDDNIQLTYFGISFSLFHAENFVTPGVEISPLYLDWLGLANVDAKPALLPLLLAGVGAGKFLIITFSWCFEGRVQTESIKY